jgi:hypothetical protein
MPGRSRKRGQHGPPPPPPRTVPARRETVRDTQSPPAHLPQPRESRSEARNAEIRATLSPYAPGERPRIVMVSAALAAAVALANFISWLAGLKINGTHPAAAGILVFTAVLLACAGGLWQMRAGAVLGFMTLMAIIAVLFTLFLIEASNVLGVVVAVAIILVTGYLFFKLVRVLSRLQMPRSG